MAFHWFARHPLDFRYLDRLSGKWVRPRYKASLDELNARYDRWQTIGPTEIRGAAPVQMFRTPARIVEKPPELRPHLAPLVVDATERFLLRLFLRRYVTWCARRRRFAAMQGAARLFAEC